MIRAPHPTRRVGLSQGERQKTYSLSFRERVRVRDAA